VPVTPSPTLNNAGANGQTAFARLCLTLGLVTCAVIVVFLVAGVPWYFSLSPTRQFAWFWPFLWIMMGLATLALCASLPALLAPRADAPSRVSSRALFGFIFGLTALVLFSPALFVALSVLGTSGAHVRDKSEQTRGDLSVLGSAIGDYRLARGVLPPWTADPQRQVSFVSEKTLPTFEAVPPGDPRGLLSVLSTPSGYPQDPFSPSKAKKSTYAYWASARNAGCILVGRGPDGAFDFDLATIEKDYDPARQDQPGLIALTYDPSNGLVSAGDIWLCYTNPDFEPANTPVPARTATPLPPSRP
jgi:hypothetical protein